MWRKAATDAHKKLAKSAEAKAATDILVERVCELAPLTYAPPLYQNPPASKTRGRPQSAVLLLSDTHIGKVVQPEQTLGLGNYSFEIFLRRLQRLEDSIRSILADHTTTEVPEIVVPIIGDILDGSLVHSVEAGLENTIFNQFYAGAHALSQFLRNLSVIAPLRIYTCVGNHPRFSNQHKMPSTNRFSNFDHFCYAYMEALLRDCPRIKFHLDKQPFALFKVQGFNFHCSHGDNFLVGGDKALGIPTHSIGRHLSSTSQNFSSAGLAAINYFCTGHLHRSFTLPHARGEFICNGGFPGLDGFGLATGFGMATPSQKLFLIHPAHGKAASYDIRLDLGDGTSHRYQLPTGFPCR